MRKVLKSLVKLTVNASFVILLAASSATMFESYMYDYIGDSVVKITKTVEQRSGGTGFQVKSPSGLQYTMTNAHICEMGNSLIATDQNGNQYRINVIEIDTEHDLCIMDPILELRPLKVASSLSLHERVWLIGHPALRPLTLESGHYAGNTTIDLATQCKTDEEVNKNALQIEELISKAKSEKDLVGLTEAWARLVLLMQGYCINPFTSQYINNIAYGGNSGSPVVNKYGNIVGVLFAGRRDQPTASYTVPIANIKKFLKNK